MSTPIHKEKKFEEEIEAVLLSRKGGYLQGNPKNFDPRLGFDCTELFTFLKGTQPKEWAKLEKSYGGEVEAKVSSYLRSEINRKGTIEVLRQGIVDRGAKLTLAFMPPSSGLNPVVIEQYKSNRLTITRQVPCTVGSKETIDTVLMVNGIPVVTVELKTPLTGQTVTNAVFQYKDRDPNSPIFGFKSGALVHMAVDPDEVMMTTKLDKKGTRFLPFNKGDKGGKGNPENPKGYKTAYLWEEVLQRDSLMDILAKFVQSQTETKRLPNGSKVKVEKLLFPRYHQLDCVRKCASHAAEHGAGQTYLIQHSAGSGKTNSIAWLAHRLTTLHNAKDETVFDSVIVVTDRIVLDDQLQDAIAQFEHKHGVVEAIKGSEGSKSAKLAEALTGGKKIIIVTIQSFGFVLEQIGSIPNRRYAVIVDEAHSSQTGESATKMRQALGSSDEDLAAAAKEQEEEDKKAEAKDDETDAAVLKVLKARKRQPNMSFFGFTATPKAKTLEYFGTVGKDRKPHPFHLYSMRQAIEEGFILDVLKNYTTYETYWRLASSNSVDPEVEKKKASRAAVRYVQLHPYNIAQKVEIILEHYVNFTSKQIGGKAKAMVVTSSRKAAVRYKEAFDKILVKKKIKGVKAIVAFSGEVQDEGKSHTEQSMNGFSGRQIPEKFESDEYQVLLVADKFQTGFDQPYLHTLFVDKRLDGVQAVQTLSRVNRTCPLKEDTFVLDFVNNADDIKKAFLPYYQATEVSEVTDPNVLYRLKDQIMDRGIINKDDIEGVAKIAFKPAGEAGANDQGKIHALIDPAVTRYKEKLDESEQREFAGDLQSFLRTYAFLAQLIDFEDTDLEKLYAYGKFLARKLPRTQGRNLTLDDEVRLTFYRTQKVFEGSLSLGATDAGTVKGIGDAPKKGGAGGTVVRLSTIIDVLNQRFGADLSQEDQLLFDAIEGDMARDHELRTQALNNDLKNFAFPAKEKISGAFLERTEKNQGLFTRYLADEAFRNVIEQVMAQSLYDRLRREAGEAEKIA
ncbi:MAG: type I restriction endonuclease subunit R [Proteobacteria bacterium]|nr:type I restriction endonuclease subunit R [Pseudomonadota bacterium]